MAEPAADIGVIGLAVMGRNLVLNLADHGHRVAVYNRTQQRTDDFIAAEVGDRAIVARYDLRSLLDALLRPRRVLLMVQAGAAVDALLDELLPMLNPGDVVIDGGNAHYPDTERRAARLASMGIGFIGTGISGGEEGARHGPSIMPGGHREAWPLVRDLLQSIAARVDGEPCCQWVGRGGAGHYVKMVHNGIEYGDMQLIAEAWQLLRRLGIDDEAIAESFSEWNRGKLESYLIEITAQILRARENDGILRVDRILDSAGQKGTGRWTAADALERGIPLTLIGAAVNARFLSALIDERARAAERLSRSTTPRPRPDTETAQAIVDDLGAALYAAKILSYAQGFMLMRAASEAQDWGLAFGDIALLWRGGCIIRSRFLGEIKRAFERDPHLENLLLDEFFANAVIAAEPAWRRTVIRGIETGVPMPAFTSALAFLDGYRTARGSASLLQAQRDYFGAHTYRRIDQPPDAVFHYDWGGNAGEQPVD